MRGLIICCLVALATCQSVRYDLNLNPKKSYVYKYVGMVNFGLGMPNLAESGVKMSCSVKIAGLSPQTFMLQVSDLAFEEFNGFPGKSSYSDSPKLSQRISAQLVKPFVFDYAGGHVGDIRAAAEVSDTVVNIVRGILSFFQVTVKTTQRVYELEELDIHGKCQSNYATEENMETKDMMITQVIDVDNCIEKAAVYRGMAMAVVDKVSKQRGESIVSTVRYVYTVKPTAEGGIITRASGLERQNFSPFNVKGGSVKMQATKELVLVRVSDTEAVFTAAPMESRGNIVFKIPDEGEDIPVLMQNLQDPIPKAVELLKKLSEANKYHIDSATTEDSIKLYQLLRLIPYEAMEEMWKEFHSDIELRRWFLDMMVEVADVRILKFLEARFQAQDISKFEAWESYYVAMLHTKPTPEVVETVKGFLKLPFSKSNEHLWQMVVLGYGSLVYKHCAYYTPCPVSAVQPLLDMAMDGLKSKNEDYMVLALKALGNAGHPSSIKTIMRFLPGVAATPVDLPPRVLSAAVQSMRLIAVRDPHSVQDITLSLFLEKDLPVELRMLSFMVMFESKPSLALVSTVAAHLLEEKDMHVASFAYSYLRSLARSSTPDNHFLSTACNVAVKILSPKFGRLCYHYSKAIRMDWFSDDFLIGTSMEVFMLRSATSTFPSEMMMKGKFYFIGRILQLLEFGIRAETIKELFGANIPGFKEDLSFSDFYALFAALQNWKILPEDKPVLTAFLRASGQELFFADINKQLIGDIVKAFNPAGKDNTIFEALESLQKGFSWHKTKSLLFFEIRYIQASSLGLPLEISKYYNVVNGLTMNAKAAITPPVTSHLGQVLNSEISLESDGFIGFTKDLYVFYGINTELFQCGTEFKAKVPTALPWQFTAKINLREKKFELDFPALKKEIEVYAIRSNVYAISRNIEDLAAAKMTPMMPNLIDKMVEIPEMEMPNKWHPRAKVCAESRIYGAGVCVETELRREYYHEEYPLYYFLGYTNIAVKLVPVATATAVDKIHFEFDFGKNLVAPQEFLSALRTISKKAMEHLGSESASGEIGSHSSSKIKNPFTSPESLFTFKALAINGVQKPEGFDAAVYYTPEGDVQNTQLIVSEVGEDTNWKMCIDTTVEGRVEAKAHVRWGAECQSYEMSMRASTVHMPGSSPTMKAKVHWTKVPEAMMEAGHRVESYIPGMAFLFGFYQQNEGNNKQEISATVIASSADSVDVKLEFPEYTVYRQAIQFPLPAFTFGRHSNMTVRTQ